MGITIFFQVQSRIQKYFLKLQKAGLPVPGKLSKHSKQARSTGQSNFTIFHETIFNKKPSAVKTVRKTTDRMQLFKIF